jgi:MFS family permease
MRLLLLIQVIFWLRGSILAPVLPLFIRGMGVTLTEIGLLVMVEAMGWAIFEPIFGVVADRLGKKRLIIYSIVASSLIYLSYTLVSSVWQLYLIYFAMSSNMAAGAVATRAMTAELLPRESRGKIYGRFMATMSMGQIFGPFLGGFLADTIGSTVPFYVSGGLGILSLAATLSMRYEEKLGDDVSSVDASSRGRLLTQPFLLLLLVRLLYMFPMNFRQSSLPIFLHESQSFGASESQIGVYMTIALFASSLSQLFLGALSDKVGSKKLVIAGLSLGGLNYLGLVYFSGLLPLYFLGVFQGVSFAAVDLSMMIYLMSIIPEGGSGRAMGTYGFAEDIGGMIAAPSLGMIYDRAGPLFAVLSVSTVMMCGAALSTLLPHGAEEKENPAKKTAD